VTTRTREHLDPIDRTAGGVSKARIITFDTLKEKADWLDAAASLDTALAYCREFARRFQSIEDPEARARSIQRWVRDHIHYVQDWRIVEGLPGEEFADSETVLRRGYDDCDGKSRLFVCLARICGLEARIRPIFARHPLDFVHVQAEVRWPGSERSAHAEPGGWMLVELILKFCEIGCNPDDMPRDARGKRIIA
jgi:transglutaminase-like putative cysteine protease